MSAAAIPWAFTAAITLVISFAFPRSAAEAVFASVETPKETCARSGVVATEPLPGDDDRVLDGGRRGCAARPRPSRATRTAATAPMTASDFMCPLYAADRTPCHIRPWRRFGGVRPWRSRSPGTASSVVGSPAGAAQADEERQARAGAEAAHRHRRLLREAVALAQVAGGAGGDDVLPDRVAPAAAREDVVEGEPAAGRPAVDAAPVVAGEERPARDLALRRPRHADVLDEPDHVRPRERVGRRMQRRRRAPRAPRPSP